MRCGCLKPEPSVDLLAPVQLFQSHGQEPCGFGGLLVPKLCSARLLDELADRIWK
jgi:hypothetical protein